MNAGGWMTMMLSLGVVWTGTIWSFRKVLSKRRARPTGTAGSPEDER